MIQNVTSSISIFGNLWKAGRYTAGLVKESYSDVEAKQAYIEASNAYQSKFAARHGQIKVMPELMQSPRSLLSIYTATQLSDKKGTHSFVTPDNLDQRYRTRGKRSFQFEENSQDGMTIAKSESRLMVLGEPGSGKSTFLKMLGLEAFKGKSGQLQRSQVPVFIELKTFQSIDIDLNAAIVKEFEVCGFPNAVDLAESALKDGKLLILLDGLDEVPARNTTRVIEHIEDFSTQYSRNSFVVSCRIAAYRSMSFKNFIDTTVVSFGDRQIRQFIQQWFSSDVDTESGIADRYWKLLKKPENAAAKELAQTPLLLTFFCLIYDNEQTLPATRSILYNSALDIILKEWTAQQRVDREPVYEGFHPVLEKELLSEIAFVNFKEDRLFFLKSEIVQKITDFLADTLNAPKHLDGNAVLTAIEVQQGILAKRAVHTYSFSHLTLHEYLTALYIVNNNLTESLVKDHLLDQRWREVFLLATGLMGRRGHQLLNLLSIRSKALLANYPKLHQLLVWADGLAQSTNDKFKAYEKRAALLHVVIEGARNRSQDANRRVDLAIDSAISNAIDSALVISDTIADTFDSALESDIAASIFESNDHAIACYGAIDRAFEQAIAIDKVNYLIHAQVLNFPFQDDFLRHAAQLKSQIPSKHAPSDDWNGYAHRLEVLLFAVLETTPEMIAFSQEEWKVLENHLYSSELLLRCKQASIGISRQAWEQIERDFLKV